MLESFNWDDLRHFLAVARAGTVSLAARRIGVDHATIIRRIDALERSLGAKLFERNPRGYNLTHRGERLLASVEIMEDVAQKVGREIGSKNRGISGLVRISALGGFGSYFLAGRISKFAADHPKLSIEFTTIQQIIALSRYEADIAVTLRPTQTGRFVSEKLTDYALHVYSSRRYLEAHPPIKTVEDLSAHPFVGYIDDLVFVRDLDYLHEIRPGLRAQLQSSSQYVQMEAAQSGYGLVVLPAFVAKHSPELVPVLADTVTLRRTFWLVVNAEIAESARVAVVIEFIKSLVQTEQKLFLGQT
jgi:DNA-binding transcriptional LysR family regulator